jgi:hypothetical protein
MNDLPPLHVAFTMNCEGASSRDSSTAPRSWEQGARTMGAFCGRLLEAGYPPTLFVAPDCADEQAPILEELASRGCELGVFLSPTMVSEGRYRQPFGAFTARQQRELVEVAAERFESALGIQPRSFRAQHYSASDETFRTLFELGFRQSSLSSPGRNAPREHAVWRNANPDPHHVDPANRLIAGAMPFLELPVTTNPAQVDREGSPDDLCIERGPFAAWHKPIIEQQLARMDAAQTRFRALCIVTSNSMLYTRPGEQPQVQLGAFTSRGRRPISQSVNDVHTETLVALLDLFDSLAARYTIVPVTLAAAHDAFRRMS